jgi:hypothetical protein
MIGKQTIEEKWHQQSEAAKRQAEQLSHGREREALARKARQLETASQINQWISSPGLASPKWARPLTEAFFEGQMIRCPLCKESMKKQGRTFQCDPCRQIIIFFTVSDASPYIALGVVDRVAKPMKRLREPTVNFESNPLI